MSALLILAGLLLLLWALIWLVMRAFDTSLLWGWGSLVPPITLLFIIRQWPKARTPVFLSGLAIGTLIVGLAQMTATNPERISEIFSLQWMQQEPPASDLNIRLTGKLNGQAFNPQTAELIDGVLTLREGKDFYAWRELIIRFPGEPVGALKLDVLPQDQGVVPVVELNWLMPEQDLPEAKRIARGYSLHINLQPVAPNKMSGHFHLVLPSRFKTSLSGDLELYTDRLRYQNGKLDTRHNSRETVRRVIEDYLQRRFPSASVEIVELPAFGFSSKTIDMSVSIRVNDQSLQLPLELEKNDLQGWQVAKDHYSAPAKVQEAAEPEQTQAPVSEAEPGRILDRRTRFSLSRLLRSPDNYQHMMMRVESVAGVTAEGRFVGIGKDGDLIIRSPLSGAGEATFRMRPDDVLNIQLLEP